MRWNRPFISGNPDQGWCIIRIVGRNTCQFATPSAWRRQALSPLWAASATATTTRSPKRSTACSRPRSFTDVAHGAASTPWNTPPSNGSTGSTTAACWNPSGISRQQRPRQTITQLWKDQTWPRNLDKSASGKPGTVQKEVFEVVQRGVDLRLDERNREREPGRFLGTRGRLPFDLLPIEENAIGANDRDRVSLPFKAHQGDVLFRQPVYRVKGDVA